MRLRFPPFSLADIDMSHITFAGLVHLIQIRADDVDPPPFSLAFEIGTPNRPELLHPFASAIDSPPLEAPEQMVRSFPPTSNPVVAKHRAHKSSLVPGGTTIGRSENRL